MRRFIAALLLIFTCATIAYAQDAPQPVQDAFNDLNQRLGTQFLPTDFDWTWAERQFDNRALGCARFDTGTLVPETIGGYEVVLRPPGLGEWDYRISYDPAIFIQCSPAPTPTPLPTLTLAPTFTPFPTNTPAPSRTPSGCGALPSRLQAGQSGRVSSGIPNNLRSGPGVSTDYLGEIPNHAVFTILDGPRCSNDGAWWQVDYNGLVGWTLEGQNSEYWLQPADMPVESTATLAPSEVALPQTPTQPVCNPAAPPRMVVGMRGRVTPGFPNNVRSGPGTSAEYVGEIPVGGVFNVLAGPECGSRMAWWQVDYNGLMGWTPEGETAADYWLEPLLDLQPIGFGNSSQLVALTQFQAAADGAVYEFTVAQDGSIFLSDLESVLFDHTAGTLTWTPSPAILRNQAWVLEDGSIIQFDSLTGIFTDYDSGLALLTVDSTPFLHTALSADGHYLALTSRDGMFTTYQRDGMTYAPVYTDRVDMSVTAPRYYWTATGQYFVVVSQAEMRVWESSSWHLLYTIRYDGWQPAEVVLSRDQQQLSVVGLTNNDEARVLTFDLANGNQIADTTLNTIVYDAVYLNDHETVVLAGRTIDGTGEIYLLNTLTGQNTRIEGEPGIDFSEIAVSPDGLMLMALSRDGALHVWGVR